MNCEFFVILVDELASGRLNDTALSRRLLNHAGKCVECGKRLHEAEVLTESLHALAAADALQQAPDRVEAALLNYLGRRRRNGFAGLWEENKWMAVAAGVGLVAIGLAIGFRHRPQPVRSSQPVITAPSIPSTARNTGRMEAPARAGAGPTGPQGQRSFPKEVLPEYSGFIPLPYGEGSAFLGSGQIVRVEVTRSALASMGFPVAGATSESYVQADVLIGEDGMARAIRFEPPENGSSR
ncbi:MAG TPA: hypothetical protein VKV79_07400 [Terriglobia bacterium]|nr:hypothetical protein [Terriglobia bacterium]